MACWAVVFGFKPTDFKNYSTTKGVHDAGTWS